MTTTNHVKGWLGVLMAEDSSFHWLTKPRHVYSETSRRASLEFVCIFWTRRGSTTIFAVICSGPLT